MGETAENVAERYGITRDDQDAFALQQPPARDRGRRRQGASTRNSSRSALLRSAGAASRSLVERRRGPAPRRQPRAPGQAEARVPRGRHRHRRQRLDPQRRRRLPGDGLGGGRRRSSARSRWRGSSPTGVAGVDPAVMGIGPVPAIRMALERGLADARRDRPDRDQRGLRLAGARLRRRAWNRRGAPQRQRRRDRDRPPARLLGRPPGRHPGARAAPAQRAATASPPCASASARASRP